MGRHRHQACRIRCPPTAVADVAKPLVLQSAAWAARTSLASRTENPTKMGVHKPSGIAPASSSLAGTFAAAIVAYVHRLAQH